MELKKCPKCKRYGVSFDYNRGVEFCHWRDCNWVNREKIELPKAHATIITNKKCPYCGSNNVSWNWLHAWDGDVKRYCEENPHLTREELAQAMWFHECLDCGGVSETSQKVVIIAQSIDQ